MDTNALLQRWSTLSLAEIEDEIVSGKDQDSAAQLVGADTLAEIRGISFAPPAAGPRANVVLLPGIMGSLLTSVRGVTSLLWINPLLFLKGNGRFLRLSADGSTDASPEVECMPVGLEKLTYLKLSLLLNRHCSLFEFPYDWRKSIETNADILHQSIARWAGGDPKRKFTLVAHSMGGLVSRAYMARHPQAAQQHVEHLIMHGTPNFGAANAVDNLLNGNAMMATVDRLNPSNEMSELIYGLPSVYQLLPAPQDLFPSGRAYPVGFDLYDAKAWGTPKVRQDYLDGALHLHQSLAQSDPQIRMTVIAGCHVETAVGAKFGTVPSAPHLILDSVTEGENSGDGTVPLWSSRLPGAEMYYVQAEHRNLPGDGDVIRATLNLIQGEVCELPTVLPKRRQPLFRIDLPFSPDTAAEDLRLKIESGSAGGEDLKRMFFAL